jgi:hypothetical protein
MPKSPAPRLACVSAARAMARSWRTYLVIAAVILALVGVLPALALQRGYSGLIAGAIAVLVVVSLVTQDHPATDPTVEQRWGLAPFRKMRGWSVTDKLPFERDDVDHAVVTPSAVLAVESRYHGSAASPERLIRDLAAAERSANKVRLLLRAEQLRDAAEVVPVLIVWGPGAPELAQGHELREGVHVVDGAHPERWRDLFNVPRLSPGMRRELHLRFEQFVLDRSTYDARVLPSLRAEVWREFCAGIADERAERATRRRPGLLPTNLTAVPAPAVVGVPTTTAVAAGATQVRRLAR